MRLLLPDGTTSFDFAEPLVLGDGQHGLPEGVRLLLEPVEGHAVLHNTSASSQDVHVEVLGAEGGWELTDFLTQGMVRVPPVRC